MNLLRQGFQNLSSDRETYMIEIIYHIAVQVVKYNQSI